MKKSDALIYLATGPEQLHLNLVPEESIGHYNLAIISGYQLVWPVAGEIKTPTLNQIDLLKTRFSNKYFLLLDRICGVKDPVCIVGHINRSGNNNLVSNTPFKDKPRFPDSSRIYHKISDLKRVVVHTLGKDRFADCRQIEGLIWSEEAALITTVVDYIGWAVYALGIPDFGINIYDLLDSFLE